MTCPLHKKDVSTVCHKCPWWTRLVGKHPQTGAEIDEWGCAIAWMPTLMIETAKEARQGAAAIETFRNEFANVGNGLVNLANQRKLVQ